VKKPTYERKVNRDFANAELSNRYHVMDIGRSLLPVAGRAEFAVLRMIRIRLRIIYRSCWKADITQVDYRTITTVSSELILILTINDLYASMF
jgi:hypothetical protein